MMARKMTQKQKKLIIKNYSLMQRFIEGREEKGLVPDHLQDDFNSDMALALCTSAIKFDETMGFKFSTYAYGGFNICCTNLKDRKEVSYKRNNFLTQKKVSSLLKHVAVDEKHLAYDLVIKLIDHANLTWREDTILRSYYFEGENMAEIGRSFKVTRARISQVINKALRKLQRLVEREHLLLDDFYE
jgi:RNA polymerase sigma factor (sigma-70 family)